MFHEPAPQNATLPPAFVELSWLVVPAGLITFHIVHVTRHGLKA
ncbi:hypothetical protein ACIRRA_36980 [Nocardia sp. NPDC101769]